MPLVPTRSALCFLCVWNTSLFSCFVLSLSLTVLYVVAVPLSLLALDVEVSPSISSLVVFHCPCRNVLEKPRCFVHTMALSPRRRHSYLTAHCCCRTAVRTGSACPPLFGRWLSKAWPLHHSGGEETLQWTALRWLGFCPWDCENEGRVGGHG